MSLVALQESAKTPKYQQTQWKALLDTQVEKSKTTKKTIKEWRKGQKKFRANVATIKSCLPVNSRCRVRGAMAGSQRPLGGTVVNM